MQKQTLINKTLSRIETFKAYTGKIISIAVSPDGRYTAISDSSQVRIWNTMTLNAMPISFQNGTVRKLIFSPDGEFLMAGLDKG